MNLLEDIIKKQRQKILQKQEEIIGKALEKNGIRVHNRQEFIEKVGNRCTWEHYVNYSHLKLDGKPILMLMDSKVKQEQTNDFVTRFTAYQQYKIL